MGQAHARARLPMRATKHATKHATMHATKHATMHATKHATMHATKHATMCGRTAAQRTVRSRAPGVEHRRVARSRRSLGLRLGPSSPSTRVARWQADCRSGRQCRRRHAARKRWHMVRWSPSGEAATHQHADGCSRAVRAVRASQRQRDSVTDSALHHRSRNRSWYRYRYPYNPCRPQRQLLPPHLRLPACARWQMKRLRPRGPLLAPVPRTASPQPGPKIRQPGPKIRQPGPKIPLPRFRRRRHRRALAPPRPVALRSPVCATKPGCTLNTRQPS